MGTRSNIGVENKDGTVDGVYCHWDGYPSGAGVTLRDSYADEESARALVSLGDISCLRKEYKAPEGHSYDNPVDGVTVYYGRDRGEEDVATTRFASVSKFIEQGEEYIYILTINHGWVCSDHGSEPVPLEYVIAADS